MRHNTGEPHETAKARALGRSTSAQQMQPATVSASVAGQGLTAAQRSALVAAIRAEDLRHEARDLI